MPVQGAQDEIEITVSKEAKGAAKETRTQVTEDDQVPGVTGRHPELDREHDRKGGKVLVRRQLSVKEMMHKMSQRICKVTQGEGEGGASGTQGKERVVVKGMSQPRKGGSPEEQSGLVVNNGLGTNRARVQTGGQTGGQKSSTLGKLKQLGHELEEKLNVVKVEANAKAIKRGTVNEFLSVRTESKTEESSSVVDPEEGEIGDSQDTEKPIEDL